MECVKMSDKLVEIESENWAALRNLYSAEDPNTIYAHCTVDNYIRWLETEPQQKDWFIYSLNGDWSDGTYAVVVSMDLFGVPISEDFEFEIEYLLWNLGSELCVYSNTGCNGRTFDSITSTT